MRVMLDEGAYIPTRAHPTDAGLDLRCKSYCTIPPHGHVLIDTGVHIEIPLGCVGLLTSKSGLMRQGITCRGTIDCGYTGTIQAEVFNHGDEPFFFATGSKVTQLVILPCVFPTVDIVDSLEETDRGSDGFGSTGR